MRKIILLIVIQSIVGFAFSQTVLQETYTLEHKAEYMLPSAESISKVKSVARPTGLFTGIPEISVPVWNNEYSSFSIHLKYHASGIQVNEQASSVGLGWSLDAGGMIARVVRGIPDETPTYGYLNLSSSLKTDYNKDLDDYTSDHSIQLFNVNGTYDAAPDIFYYDFQGIKGKFIITDQNNVISVPHNNLKFEVDMASSEITGIEITTPDGSNYVFANRETVTVNSGSNYLGYSSYTSAWYLTAAGTIESKDIIIEYNQVTENITRNLYRYEYYNMAGTKVSGTASVSLTVSRPEYAKITDKNTKVEFTYGVNNELSEMKVYGFNPDYFDTAIRYDHHTTIGFNYGNFTLDNGQTDINRTRRLESVDMGIDYKRRYTFAYNSTPIPHVNSIEQDLWGYYNDNNAGTFHPQLYYSAGNYEAINISTVNIAGANRNVNSTAVKAGILTSVTNPEGGVTEYGYEPQAFIYNSQEIFGGGLRINNIQYYDLNSDHPVKTINYLYNQWGTSVETGVLMSAPNFAYYLDHNQVIGGSDRHSYRYANYSAGLTAHTNPVFYEQVTTDYNGIGHTVVDFEMPIAANHVSNIFSDQLSNEISLIKQQPTNTHYSIDARFLGKGYGSYFCYDWDYPYIDMETNYNSSGAVVNKVDYEYHHMEDDVAVHGFFTGPAEHYYKQTSSDGDPTGDGGDGGTGGGDPVITDYNNYHRTLHKFYYPTAWKLLKSEEVTNYENGVGISNIKSYSYDTFTSDYRLPVRTETTNANGLKRYRKVKYPYHFDYDPDGLESNLVTYNENLEASLEGNPDNYYTQDGGDVYLNQGVTGDHDYAEQFTPHRVAIELLKIRGNVSQPIEVIEGIILADQSNKITKASVSLFKQHENGAVVPVEEYILEGPIDSTTLAESRLVPQDPGYAFFTFDNGDYKLVNTYNLYNEKGQLAESKGVDGVITSYKRSRFGNYLIAKGINTPYSVIENYTGSSEPARTGERFITTYAYKPLAGIKRVTDARGMNTYSIYDTDGSLIAVKDHDKNIREYYDFNIVHGSGERKVDETTDPDGNTYFLDMDPEAGLILTYNEYCHSVDVGIMNFNPAFQYQVDYGDGTVEMVNTNNTEHYYPDEHKYTVIVKVMKNGFTIQTVTGNVSNIERKPLQKLFTYTDFAMDQTYPDISNATFVNLQIDLRLSQGNGTYDVTWAVTDQSTGTTETTEDPGVLCHGYSGLTLTTDGTYNITCTIDDGDETGPVSVTWSNVTIDTGELPPN